MSWRGTRSFPWSGRWADLGSSVIHLDVPGLVYYHSEVYKKIFFDFFTLRESALIFTAHTARGMDFSPGLAVRLRAAHISGVQGFEVDRGAIHFLRSMDNGKKTAWISPLTAQVVVSIRPGACRPFQGKPGQEGEVTVHHMGPCREMGEMTARYGGGTKPIRFKGTKQTRTGFKSLSEAEIVVSVGNGIGSRENLDLIHEMAGFFNKSAVGGSRIVCDKGLLGYGHQVGITGAVVAPELYMAWGISGSAQHIAGMDQSQFVVSINKDPTAPMMNMADVCIEADLNEFLPICLKTLTGELDP